MNTNELKAATVKAGMSNTDLAARLGMSNQAYYNKLNGKTEFKNSEILRLSRLLSLDLNAVNSIFFDVYVN